MGPSLVAGIIAATAALVGAALARFGGPRGAAWGIALCGPAVSLAIAGGTVAPWVAPVDGVVSEQPPSNSRRCNLVVVGRSPWRELVSKDLCAACPVGSRATKPAWSFAMTCRGAPVDTPSIVVPMYVAALLGAAAGFAAYGASRLRRAPR